MDARSKITRLCSLCYSLLILLMTTSTIYARTGVIPQPSNLNPASSLPGWFQIVLKDSDGVALKAATFTIRQRSDLKAHKLYPMSLTMKLENPEGIYDFVDVLPWSVYDVSVTHGELWESFYAPVFPGFITVLNVVATPGEKIYLQGHCPVQSFQPLLSIPSIELIAIAPRVHHPIEFVTPSTVPSGVGGEPFLPDTTVTPMTLPNGIIMRKKA